MGWICFITKVVLVPYILNRAYKKMGEPSDASLKAGLKPRGPFASLPSRSRFALPS